MKECGTRSRESHFLLFPAHHLWYSLLRILSSLSSEISMTAFSYTHDFNTGSPSLRIEATHSMIHDSPSSTTNTIKRSPTFPTDVDVLLASDLVISISATKDRTNLTSSEVSKSAVAIHLKRYLETVCITAMLATLTTDRRSLNHQNIKLLGLNRVSTIYVDETADVTKRKLVCIAYMHLMNPKYTLHSSIERLATFIPESSTLSF